MANMLAARPAQYEEKAVIEVRRQVNQIQYLMRDVLKSGEHYGNIPGVPQPTLFQSGAEKICYMFKLVPHYQIEKEPIEGMPGHREYTVTCTLTGPDGQTKGEGVASCSTMESKYRYRNVADYEVTGEPIPPDARERKQEYRRMGYGMKKVDGNWEWVRYGDSSKQENPDIADQWNTVLQMAEKRAFVRATRSTTAASDIFTQDVEDLPQYQEQEMPPKEDLAELRSMTDALVSQGHDEMQTKRDLYVEYKQGGIEAARALRDRMSSDESDAMPDEIDF